jgi:hypothetical protein
MKITTSLDILALILTMCLIIIFIVYLVLKHKQPIKEDFQNHEINNNFYMNMNLDHSILNDKKIKSSELCIYNMDSQNKEIIDIECITGQEIAAFNDLAQFRRKNVCIDEECLNSDDARLLRGDQGDPLIKFHTNHIKSNHNEIPTTCLGYNDITLFKKGTDTECTNRQCPSSAPSCTEGKCLCSPSILGSVKCDSGDVADFKIERSNIKSSKLMDMFPNSKLQFNGGISGSSGSSGSQRLIAPIHSN